MVSRSFVVALALVAVGAVPTARAEPLDEARVIALVRAGHPDVLAARQVVGVAVAQERGAGLIPNPILAWSREDFPGGVGPESADNLLLARWGGNQAA